jgi:iron complex outermembrane receptor protein
MYREVGRAPLWGICRLRDAQPRERAWACATAGVQAGAKFKEDRYDVALWVDNAFDKVYFQSLASTSIVVARPSPNWLM